MVLAARDSSRLTEQVAALRAAGAATVHTVEFDADDLSSHESLVHELAVRFGAPRIAVLAFGILGDQARAENDSAHASAIVHTDYVAQVSLLTALAVVMRSAGMGALVVFSSVAGCGSAGQLCLDRPKPAWTGSRMVWPMHCTAAVCGC